MNRSLSTYAITPVELKGVRLKISKVPEVKSSRRSNLFGWRKCSDASSFDSINDDEHELHPSMRAVIWCQQDESSNGVVAERILSCPLEVVSEDEDGGMIMNCVWPDGAILYVPNVSHANNEEQVTLGLGIQMQNEALLSIGTASVSFLGCGSTFLIFLPIKQSEDQVGNDRYNFDVSSSRMSTVLDMIDAELSNFVVDEFSKKSSMTLFSENRTTKSEYVEDDWKPWEADDIKIQKVDDFSFEPLVYEDVNAVEQMDQIASVESVASVEQEEQTDYVEAMKTLEIFEVKTTINDAINDYPSTRLNFLIDEEKNGDNGDIKTVGLKGKRTQSNVDYPSSLIEFTHETGDMNQVEFTDDAVRSPGKRTKKPAKMIFKDLEGILKRRPKDTLKKNNKPTGKSTCTVATASTCSSVSSEITPDLRSSDITAEESDVAGCGAGCGSALVELIDIISRRNCVQKNFELCLEEFFDAADDNSFASESLYSESVCQDVHKSKKVNGQGIPVRKKVDEQSLVEEVELLAHARTKKKKKRFVNKSKLVEL
mmetsp:Transcript_27079/g.46031  ORF Transcript_27079/g.46031 Transcript_27079/m.46031 type:complete len:541 (+) Transcript_27079:75-1697(+)